LNLRVIEQLKVRFFWLNDEEPFPYELSCCLALDPRSWTNDILEDSVKELLIKLMKNKWSEEYEETPAMKSSFSLMCFTEQSPPSNSFSNEVEEFTTLKINSNDFNLFTFWRTESKRFPHLAQLFRHFGCIQTSSSSSERLFSRSGFMLSETSSYERPNF